MINEIKKDNIVPSGFKQLDDLTVGFKKSNLILLASRPGIGKTALALSFMQNTAIKNNIPTLFFSLETEANQLIIRLLSNESQLSSQIIRTANFSGKDYKRITLGLERLRTSLIHIDDTPNLTIEKICENARKSYNNEGVRFIIIDYFQLILINSENVDREEKTKIIFGRLKSLSKELNIPIILLAQLNRKVESAINKRPKLIHLNHHSIIERYSDVILFLHRPDISNPNDDTSAKEIVEVIVAKQNGRKLGTMKLQFIKEYGRFMELD